ncbi:MAG: hypothetical protein R6X02_07615 [Enhygromyxa sp.]
MSNDEERALLDAYAQATSPSPSEVERALTRTLARIESAERPTSLPGQRRGYVWVAAAGLATLAIASAAIAGVRWYQARPQPETQTYGAARLDRGGDGLEARATPRSSSVTEPPLEPTLVEQEQVPAPAEPEQAPEDQALELPKPPTNDAPAPRRRARPKPAEDPQPEATPASDSGSELAAESRLLALIRRALRDEDFEAALARAEEHARRHPQGALTEERLILEAVAACRGQQRSRGLAAAKQLREQFPNTAALAKVERSCAED